MQGTSLTEICISVKYNIYLLQSPFISHHSFDICFYFLGVSGVKGRDLGLGSKILDSASGLNNLGLMRKQSGLSPWRERGHETFVWASGIHVDSERGAQLLNREQGIWPLGPAVQRVPCKWPHVFHGCPQGSHVRPAAFHPPHLRTGARKGPGGRGRWPAAVSGTRWFLVVPA